MRFAVLRLVKLFHVLDLWHTTSASTSKHMPTTRQWEIQNSVFRTPAHFFPPHFLKAQNILPVIEGKII